MIKDFVRDEFGYTNQYFWDLDDIVWRCCRLQEYIYTYLNIVGHEDEVK